MRRITKILVGLTLAAGTFGGTAAFAMDDGYHYRSTTSYYYTSPDTTTYYYTAPDTDTMTYYYTAPDTTTYYAPPRTTTYYYTSPRMGYYYAPSATFGYYDNVYNPYWSYGGPLGQGSGHDIRVGR